MGIIPPILFLVFNRPKATKLVFAEIKKAKPDRLFIAADGPRKERIGEVDLCREVREIIDEIDWNCKVETLFRNENLGCGNAVKSAIEWFFSYVPEGIILEDDCLPDQTFFRFCGNMLEYYRHDENVMHVSGSNFQFGKSRGNSSYYFSKFIEIWGWATWRRAWQHYDFTLDTYDLTARGKINSYFDNKNFFNYWSKKFEDIQLGRIDTWDFQWMYTVAKQNGLCINPNQNLIKNIGFDENGTHTKGRSSAYYKVINNPVYSMPRMIIHPSDIFSDAEADNYTFRVRHQLPFLYRAINKTYLMLRSL